MSGMEFEDFCNQNNIVVKYYNFSTKIRGLCVKQGDCFIVAINPKFSFGSQKKTLQHEIMHIMMNHFACDPCEIEQCEIEIRNIVNRYELIFEEQV